MTKKQLLNWHGGRLPKGKGPTSCHSWPGWRCSIRGLRWFVIFYFNWLQLQQWPLTWKVFTRGLSSFCQRQRLCSKQLWDAQPVDTAAKVPVLLEILQRRLLPMFTPILMLFFKFKEDIEGQRYNINDNQIPINVLYAFVMSSTLYPLDNQ